MIPVYLGIGTKYVCVSTCRYERQVGVVHELTRSSSPQSVVVRACRLGYDRCFRYRGTLSVQSTSSGLYN
jgi:hypothetical protein